MFEGLGVTWPTYADWVSAGIAFVIVLLAWGISHLIARKAAPWLAELWAQRAGARGEGLAPRMGDLARYLSVSLILAVIVNADSWRPLSAIVLGTALAASAALLISGLARGLQLPRWAAALLAGTAFVALLTRVVGGLEPITQTLDRVGFTAGDHRFSLLSVLQIVLTLVALYALVKLVNRIAGHSIKHSSGLDATQKLLAQKLVGVALLIAAFFIGIDLVGIDLTALAVFSGAFGLAIGFGLQKTFGNLIAGIILLMDRSIKPGDVIVVGDSFGHVGKIGVRAVSIVTRDGKEHLIPNENLMTQEVENWSYSSPNVRVHIPVGVAYDCDLALAQKLMIEAAVAPARVLDTPKPSLWLTGFGESSVDHEILVWIADPQAGVGGVRSEILNHLWRLFKENGIEIPYPQRDIHVRSWPGPPEAEG
ncbi:mechanosensitive ion channel family protein [Sphingosinicella rhizophila]|uniref:Mechanosensitive ion channel n=1 Tax=Sphingosinicella rhizophila TaxID=3050082 RepID=A0ABU3Q7Z5_9SPHN|nr:mechanosensitive ion channel domain-containing protein [Sphingosinicella sp. GR2756]MDT9599065.1 mechanosensitive ion channel [Sphingosinicella sp. GR2756]